jgi:hypothetical protein
MKIFGYRIIDLINPVRWVMFLKHSENERTNVTEVPTDELQARAELLVYRGTLCPECEEAGKSLCCNCDWTAKAFNPEDECKDGKWESTTISAWKNTKDTLKLKFKIAR